MTLLLRLYPPFDRAFPFVLEMTCLIPAHSLLHIATGAIAFWFYFWAGRAVRFGSRSDSACLVALAGVGMVTGHSIGLACVRTITRSRC